MRYCRQKTVPLLLGHTTPHAQKHVRALLLQGLEAAQEASHLFFRLLADGAGVDEVEVSVLGAVGLDERSAALVPTANTWAICSESATFIWQPKVFMYTLFFGLDMGFI
jgi:hypothetical protein